MTRLAEPVPRPGPEEPSSPAPALEVTSLTSGYHVVAVLRGVSLAVPRAAVVALLGPNGAGKTTLLRTISGTLRATGGRISIGGTDMTSAAPHRRTKSGLRLIPEGRGIFPALTVKENLRLQRPPWSDDSDTTERAITVFPDLGRRLSQPAGSMLAASSR